MYNGKKKILKMIIQTQIIGVFMNDRYNEAVNDKIEELEEKGYKEDIDFNVYYEDVSIER